MPLHPTWQDFALRLLLTMAAGAIIGFNRGLRGEAAGFRTTILVGLAASVSMILANILMATAGKTPDSFVGIDVMRLPLGILTGVGFIGGGAIMKRGDLVIGVTTAATLWVITMIGLCLGSGQLWLGAGATLLGVLTLTVLQWVDTRIPREHRATLVIRTDAEPTIAAASRLDTVIGPLGYNASFCGRSALSSHDQAALQFDVRWRKAETAGPPLDLLSAIEARFQIVSFELMSEIRH
jgi:putative Mg2+ transporter-C (MgtC) family protein